MKKVSFLTLDKAKEIVSRIPTPFHIFVVLGALLQFLSVLLYAL